MNEHLRRSRDTFANENYVNEERREREARKAFRGEFVTGKQKSMEQSVVLYTVCFQLKCKC